MNLQQVQGHLQSFKGRVREQWDQLLVDEVAKMENHRNALSNVARFWSREAPDAVEKGIVESQPGLS